MTQLEYELIDKIQREGLDNGHWMVFDCGEGMDSCALLGETDNVTLYGRVLLVWCVKSEVEDWPNWWSYSLPMQEALWWERENVLVYPLTDR